VRWQRLFEDLEGQALAMSVAQRSAEIDDRTRSEALRVPLVNRLRAHLGRPVRLRCHGNVALAGVLERAHPEWLLIAEQAGREAIVAVSALVAVSGLGRAAQSAASVLDDRVDLRLALRTLARDRAVVRVQLSDASILDGTLDRVGADFVELATVPAGELRRRASVLDVVALPLEAIVAVHRDG
jgi:hypothetical protein